jgi:hypothetical protein
MPSPANNAATSPKSPAPVAGRSRTGIWIAVAAMLGLLVGYLVQSPGLKAARTDLAQTTRAYHAARLEATLSAAVIEAQSGRYEMARQRTSDFYTGLQQRLQPALAEPQQADTRTMLSERDSIITSLARNDPTSAVTLSSLLERYRETVRLAKLDTIVLASKP